MNERIAINTGPLIALGKMQALDVIAQLPYEFICPTQVETEIKNGVALGYPVAMPAWVNALSLQTPLTLVASLALDDGEAAVIQLALEQRLTALSPQSTTAPPIPQCHRHLYPPRQVTDNVLTICDI